MSFIENTIEQEREKLNGVTDGSYVTRIFIDFLVSEGVNISLEQKKAICYIAGVSRFIDNLIDDTDIPKDIILERIKGETKLPEIEKVANMLENPDQVEFFIQQTIYTIQATLRHIDRTSDPLIARSQECHNLVNAHMSPLYFNGGDDNNFIKAQALLYKVGIASYLISDIFSFFNDKRLGIKDVVKFSITTIKQIFSLYFITSSKNNFLRTAGKVISHGFFSSYYKLLGQDKLNSYEQKIRNSYTY